MDLCTDCCWSSSSSSMGCITAAVWIIPPCLQETCHTPQTAHFLSCTPINPQNESPDHPDSKIVTLRGQPDCVARAKEAIKQLLEEAAAPQEGEVEEKISCPAGIVGRIIGRGGETIRCEENGSMVMLV